MTQYAYQDSEQSVTTTVNDQTKQGIAIIDLQGHICFANPVFRAMWGKTAEEDMSGQPLRELIKSSATAQQIMSCARGDGQWAGGLTARRADGSTFRTRCTANLLKDGEGRPLCVHLRATDWTAQRVTEKGCPYRTSIVESSEDAIIGLSLDGKIRCWNTGAKRLFGYSAAEMAGKGVSLLAPADRTSEQESILRRVIHTGKAVKGFETIGVRKNGKLIDIALTVCPIKDAEGHTTGVSAILRDITKRRAAEAALRASEERYVLAAQGANDGIWDWDLRANRAYFSPRWKAMIGYEEQEIENTFEAWQSLIHPEDAESTQNALHAYLAGEAAKYEVEFRMRGKDGDYRWIFTRGTAMRDEQGRPYRMAGSHTDITERKQAEIKLREAAVAAEAANRAKSEFLATVSHEIRTPLNSIIGITDLLFAADHTPEQHELLNSLQISADSLLMMLNDILDMAKIEAGKIDLHETLFSLTGMIDSLMMMFTAHAERHGLELATHIAADIPEQLYGDENRLRQVLINLFSNAIKFTEQGGIVCSLQVAEQTADDITLHFSVRDTGIGIPPEKQQLIFDAFAQADGSVSSSYGGTGLGLAISAQLVDLVGGSIWVESVPKEGSTFHFTARLGTRDAAGAVREMAAPALAGMPVLVVDDNATNRIIIAQMLAKWQMDAVIVEDGARAIEIMRCHAAAGRAFPVVIIDAVMPGMDGLEVAAHIRRQPELAGAIIMMLTSDVRSGLISACRELGVRYQLNKPIREKQLLETIARAVGLAEEAAATPEATPLRLLLAEDNRTNRQVMTQMLTRSGHTVIVAEDGHQALDIWQREQVDVILMDVEMPGMSGNETARAIREREGEHGTRTPIIALTGRAMKKDRERSLNAGMDGYIIKPVKVDQLLKEIARSRAGAARVGNGSSLPPETATDWDPALAIAYAGGDFAQIRRLLGIFLEDCEQWLKRLHDACLAGDDAAVSHVAHTIKGAAGFLGANTALRMASALEAAALEGRAAADFEHHVKALESELWQVARGIKEYLATEKPTA